MSTLKGRDEQEALKLDESFKEIVERVRPYVLALRFPEDSNLCRKWLDKLSCASSQRSLRNRYLLELCHHLKSGRIGGIFVKPPQNGPLEVLPKICDHTVIARSSLSELSDTSSYLGPRSIMKNRNKVSVNRTTDSTSSTNCNSEISESSATPYCDKMRFDRNQLSIYRRRIESLGETINELQIENERLKRNLAYSRDNCSCKENSDSLTIDQLTVEITTLRTKLVEVNDMKEALEKNHREIVEQYKSTMTRQSNEFNEHLRKAHCKNIELEENIATMSLQFEKAMREKENETIAMELEYKNEMENSRLHCENLLAEKNRELMLKDEIINRKDNELAERDKVGRNEILLLKDKIEDLENKLETKIEDEGKLQCFLKEQCSTMKEEFMKMRTNMEIATRTENQDLIEKISTMKIAIRKLLRSKEKLSIECERKISHFLKKKDLEIKSLELQLREQHSELSTTLITEKQCELDSLVKLLEERYKELLAASDASAGKQRQSFFRKITFLENQMTNMKNGLDNDVYV